MKCDIPSFVADLLDIVHWVDNENNLYSNLMTNMGKILYSGTPGINGSHNCNKFLNMIYLSCNIQNAINAMTENAI